MTELQAKIKEVTGHIVRVAMSNDVCDYVADEVTDIVEDMMDLLVESTNYQRKAGRKPNGS